MPTSPVVINIVIACNSRYPLFRQARVFAVPFTPAIWSKRQVKFHCGCFNKLPSPEYFYRRVFAYLSYTQYLSSRLISLITTQKCNIRTSGDSPGDIRLHSVGISRGSTQYFFALFKEDKDANAVHAACRPPNINDTAWFSLPSIPP